MIDYLVGTFWAGPLLWAALYVSDHLLTFTCARLYRAQDKLLLEGSFEITPFYQADVSALRRFGPRFVFALIGSTAYVFWVRSLVGKGPVFRTVYLGVLGALVVLQMTIHLRHARNWFLYQSELPLLEGRLLYPRGVVLRTSACELLLFSGLYAILFLLTERVFVLGGAMACAVLAANHLWLARRHDAAVAKAAS